MKIKKVEIDGFRIYKNKEYGTFDFAYDKETNDGIANFISIFAPNGFGKTSFYDAVEWAFTNRINRLDKIEKFDALSKGERKENNYESIDKQPQYILRNRELESNEIGSVTITLEKNNKKIESKKLPKIHKGSSDYKSLSRKDLKKEIQREYFRNVILSQDGIDSFLRQDTPEDRFDIFMNYFWEFSEFSDTFKNIQTLLNENNKTIEQIKSDIKDIEIKINSITIPDKVIDTINDNLLNIKLDSFVLKKINKNTNEDDFTILISTLDNAYKNITSAEHGLMAQNDEKYEISKYCNRQVEFYIKSLNDFEQYSSDLKKNNAFVDIYNKIDSNKELIDGFKNRLLEVAHEYKIIKDFEKIFVEYQKKYKMKKIIKMILKKS